MKNSQQPAIESRRLASSAGLRASIVNLGATLAKLEVPAATGRRDVILSYEDPAAYATDKYYLGSTVGPFANRIHGARFRLDDEEFILDANEEEVGHCLHGGVTGLSRQYFELTESADGRRVECRCELQDGLGGFPGNREICVIYTLLSDYALAIDFEVMSDRDTVVSLANHAYFNLGGALADHELAVFANAYTPVRQGNTPTGEIRAVAGTRYDLRQLQPAGDKQYDHNFVLGEGGDETLLAAELVSPASGLRLRVHTTQPGLQLYTADYLGPPFEARGALCLEAQAFPDAPNQPAFPSARLAAGASYRQRTIYEFAEITN